jgi:glycerol-3-phosphate O-acyltransferase/dihydroxyacetone phosphate acyltransferase
MRLHWLMPVISHLGVRSYYRVTLSGSRVPTEGPVLLVANHNNSLVDPALVVVAAERNVRFLAKEPLFRDRLIGWLIRAVGSVPVYRQQDDPAKLAQNLDSFRDVHAVLAGGDAVGIFPEGISHSASQLAPLKDRSRLPDHRDGARLPRSRRVPQRGARDHHRAVPLG